MINFICGRSGSGKDTITNMLLNKHPELVSVVGYTTRPMRPGEIDGKEYHFCKTEDLNWFRDTDNIVEERVYHTAEGDWYYFTADNGFFDLSHNNYLVTGSLEMYDSYVEYFGEENIKMIYLEVPEKELLERTIERENTKANPNYAEVCRRFYADSKDFSENNLITHGIYKNNRILNVGNQEKVLTQIEEKMGLIKNKEKSSLTDKKQRDVCEASKICAFWAEELNRTKEMTKEILEEMEIDR